MEEVLKTGCSATILKQLKTVVQEFVLGYRCRPKAKNEPKMNSFKCISQGFWPYFQESYTSEEVFYQAAISVKRLWVAVSVFCVPCELETPNRAAFFNIFICLHLTITKWDNILEVTYETYYFPLYRHEDLTFMWFCCKQFSHYLYIIYEQIL